MGDSPALSTVDTPDEPETLESDLAALNALALAMRMEPAKQLELRTKIVAKWTQTHSPA